MLNRVRCCFLYTFWEMLIFSDGLGIFVKFLNFLWPFRLKRRTVKIVWKVSRFNFLNSWRRFFKLYWAMRIRFAGQCQILDRANITVTFSIKITAISDLGDKERLKSRSWGLKQKNRAEANQGGKQQIGDKDVQLTRTDLT